jgi:hypothetical protein
MQLESVAEQFSHDASVEFHDEREKSRKSMQFELETYLESLKVFSGSNGQNLVSIPSNIDLVSDAMDRGRIYLNCTPKNVAIKIVSGVTSEKSSRTLLLHTTVSIM